jgi:predicted HTH domain antitoxin
MAAHWPDREDKAKMTTISLALEDELAALLQERHQTVERSARELIILELYRRGTLSSGKAAQLLEMTRWELVRHASRLGIPFFDMTANEWESEREMARAL